MSDSLDASDPVEIRAWWQDLTYAEVHAFVTGLGVSLVAAFTGYDWAWQALGLVVAVGLLLKEAPGPQLAQLRREPWYAFGGVTTGTVTGFVMRLLASRYLSNDYFAAVSRVVSDSSVVMI